LAQFAQANSLAISGGPQIPPLSEDVQLLLPVLLDAATLSAVPYAVAAGQSLQALATLFATSASALGSSIQDIRGIFVPGASIAVGSRPPVSAGAEDSLASLLTRFAAPAPTLEELIGAIAQNQTVLRAGAVLVCPAPAVAGGQTTLEALAGALQLADPVALGRCNAALDGFLDPQKTLTLVGVQTPVGAHGTLTSLYRRAVPDGAQDFDTFLRAIANSDLLRVGAHAQLPAPAVTLSAALPAQPAVTETLTPLSTTVTIARPPEQVAAEFGPGSDVARRSSPVAAATAGTPANYDAFARSLQAAWTGQLRVAVGKPHDDAGEPGRARLYVVRLQAPDAPTPANAIRRIELRQAPSFFAPAPLCTQLVTRTVTVRSYVSGADEPLPGPGQEQTFDAIDVQGWAATALEAIELVLAAPYAAGAFAVTRAGTGGSPTFDGIVAAKRTLAQRIADSLTGVFSDTAGDVQAARAALRQTLLTSLTQGFAVATVAQLPSEISCSFAGSGADAGGHRLAGRALLPATALDGASTLGALAGRFAVHVAAVADALGGVPNLLREGLTLEANGRRWQIGAHDTMQQGADTLGLSLAEFAGTFATRAPLFRDQTSVTLSATATTVQADDTLTSAADQLAAGVVAVATANQGVPGLLRGTIYVDGQGHQVTPQTSSLAQMAGALQLSVAALALAIAGQAVLSPGCQLHLVAPAPEVAIGAGKLSLDRAQGTLELMLSVADPTRWRRLPLALAFEPAGLEYAVAAAPLTEGYESSDWLTFTTPLGGAAAAPATIAADIGQLQVPL
ncbi:MAG TPA: hypothetical protein VMS02_03795, partial [Solirubrobacteraceae bacterium]|nr:hypothetical protein [Solirubrobacteraceae bacterium]